MENLKSKRVAILGGSSGIGFAVAKAVVEEGGAVCIVSGNQQRLDKALTGLPTGSVGFAVDLKEDKQISKLFTRIGAFDHLVYTAGEALQVGDLEGLGIDKARQFFDLRYWGAFAAVKFALPFINAEGSIILTSGCAGLRPGRGWSVVASVCAAMEGLTRALAVELAPIRVNLVMPGLVRTNLWDGMESADRDGMYTQFSERLPVKFVAGPEDIAKSYIYLMQQKYSTGQRIVADGGLVLI
jgi:NAD(P)-dependent dehydrogenase (short-subunit alcohol dehydrogenase family)